MSTYNNKNCENLLNEDFPRNFIFAIVFAFLRMKQEFEETG